MYRMTKPSGERNDEQHRTGTRKEWLARGSSCSRGKGAHAAQRRPGAAAPGTALGSGSTRNTDSTPMKARPRWHSSSAAARSSSSTTSCRPHYTAGCPRARDCRWLQWLAYAHLANTTSRLRRCRGRRSPSCRAFKRPWVELPVGVSLGSDFNYDFRWATPRRSSSPQQRIQLPSLGASGLVSPSCGDSRRPAKEGPPRRDRGERRHRLGDVHARGAGMSAFVLEDGAVYHTYSTYARGLDASGGVPVARSGAAGAQRERHLVAPPRRVRQALSRVMLVTSERASHLAFFGVSALLFAASAAANDVVRVDVGDGRDCRSPGARRRSLACGS